MVRLRAPVGSRSGHAGLGGVAPKPPKYFLKDEGGHNPPSFSDLSSDRLVVFAHQRFCADHGINVGEDGAHFSVTLRAFTDYHQIGCV